MARCAARGRRRLQREERPQPRSVPWPPGTPMRIGELQVRRRDPRRTGHLADRREHFARDARSRSRWSRRGADSRHRPWADRRGRRSPGERKWVWRSCRPGIRVMPRARRRAAAARRAQARPDRDDPVARDQHVGDRGRRAGAVEDPGAADQGRRSCAGAAARHEQREQAASSAASSARRFPRSRSRKESAVARKLCQPVGMEQEGMALVREDELAIGDPPRGAARAPAAPTGRSRRCGRRRRGSAAPASASARSRPAASCPIAAGGRLLGLRRQAVGHRREASNGRRGNRPRRRTGRCSRARPSAAR